MDKFKTLYGLMIDDIIGYVKEYISDKKDIQILIGSDSQSYKNTKTVYGIVIALYSPGKGAHVLCKRDVTSFEKNMSIRLLNEVWKSIEVAEYLRENGLPKPNWIDLDLNSDVKYKSNTILRQAVGLVEGMGYKVRYKQLGALSSYAANHLVRL